MVGDTSFKILEGFHYISRTFLLREDVAEKKVYIKIFLPTRVENYLLYDFSLEEGDSFEMFNPITPFPTEGGEFILDSIRSRTLADGENYCHFYFLPSPGNTVSTENAVCIEGVGSLSLLTAPGGYPDINAAGHLSCSFKNATRVYENLDSITACEAAILSVNTSTQPLWEVQFYKNAEAVVIENASEVIKATVYSISGSKVTQLLNQTNAEKISLQTTHFPQGLYILKATAENGRVKTFKFITE